jgi:hypothetical protein
MAINFKGLNKRQNSDSSNNLHHHYDTQSPASNKNKQKQQKSTRELSSKKIPLQTLCKGKNQ